MALVSGLKIAAEVPGRSWINLLDPILPGATVWTAHVEAGCALAGVALVSVPMVALLFALGGSGGPITMLHAISFQFSRESPQSIWSALGIQGLQPLGEAAVLAFVAAAVVRLRQEPELAECRQRMAALTAVILVGLQLAANYWAFLYLVWVFPLVAMSVLAEPTAVAVRSEVSSPIPREAGLSGVPA